jgi:rhodanese-related sulfurtransferase
MIYLSLALIVILVILYRRYFPVRGLKSYQLEGLDLSKLKILDVREYNESYKNPIEGSLNIPLSYLKRNVDEIPDKDLHLIVTSLLEKNVAARVLKQKGYRVAGYSFVGDQSKESHLEIKVNY